MSENNQLTPKHSTQPIRKNVDETPPENEEAVENQQGVSRRRFLQGMGSVIAVSSIATIASCQPPTTGIQPADPERPPLPTGLQYSEVPPSPLQPPPDILRFFTPHEAHTVEALTARLLPGTPEDPGAREAGVVYYIDNLLSHEDGFAEAIYRDPPYAETYEGDTPPEDGTLNGFQVIWVPEDEIERYGYQSILNPREVFRLSVAAVDRYSVEKFGDQYVNLSEDQQDEIIQDMLDGEATGFEPLSSSESFFHSLRRYTSEGMFSDPAYGGNRNMVGWRLVGYPGAQRAYTPEEIRIEGSGLTREVWSMAELPHFHAGEPADPNVVLPVRGSEQQRFRHETHDHP